MVIKRVLGLVKLEGPALLSLMLIYCEPKALDPGPEPELNLALLKTSNTKICLVAAVMRRLNNTFSLIILC